MVLVDSGSLTRERGDVLFRQQHQLRDRVGDDGAGDRRVCRQSSVAIGLAGFTIAFYVVVGLYAQRNKLSAFYLGLAVYVLDALIYVYFQDWMSVGFHGLAAFFIFKGMARARELGRGSVEAAAGT